ncbi:MAG TPA: methyltransferase domain-containing protein [Alphaproteobacteria bacterium]|nr:methyltransferase domain-containing protein [Alphaproteobacteria bacterium]
MNSRADRLSRIQQLLQEEEFKYQKITFDVGVETEGDDRSGTADLIFPESLTGKSVLDVGCRYGFFCFDAAKRGAARVLGLDFDPDAIRKARKIEAIEGTGARFELFDAERDRVDDKFDYVLCLNLLHHLRDPIATLDRLIACTRDKLVIEAASLSRKDAKKIFDREKPATWGLWPIPFARPVLDRLAIIAMGADRKYFEANFFFTPEGLRRLLAQRGCFRSIKTKSSPFKGRFVCIAEKVAIEDLVVIAGPSCAGKSTLIEELRSGKHPELSRELSLCGGKSWEVAYPNHIAELPAGRISQMLFHYDILRPWLNGPYNHRRDRSLEILDCSRSCHTVTLLAAPADLLQRWTKREIEPLTRRGKYRGRRRQLKVVRAFEKAQSVAHLYQRWFDYLAELPGRHSILDTRVRPYGLLPTQAWPELRASL